MRFPRGIFHIPRRISEPWQVLTTEGVCQILNEGFCWSQLISQRSGPQGLGLPGILLSCTLSLWACTLSISNVLNLVHFMNQNNLLWHLPSAIADGFNSEDFVLVSFTCNFLFKCFDYVFSMKDWSFYCFSLVKSWKQIGLQGRWCSQIVRHRADPYRCLLNPWYRTACDGSLLLFRIGNLLLTSEVNLLCCGLTLLD